MRINDVVARLESRGVPGKQFWEDDLEMSMELALRPTLVNGAIGDWIGKRTGRQLGVLCRSMGIDGEGSTQKLRAAVRSREEDLLPYVLVEYFAKWAATGDAKAPRYHKIPGLGTVEEVRDRVFAALG